MNRATRLVAGAIVAAGLTAGAAGAAQAAPVGYHPASCTKSVFTVVWKPGAGVYSAAIRDDAHQVGFKKYGEHVTAETGKNTGENWTKVYLGVGGYGFMPKDSVTYIGCN